MSQLGFIALLKCKRGFKRNEILLGVFLFLCFCSYGGRSESVGIEDKIKTFLRSHCDKQNQTLEQEEYEIFLRCNPTQAAMIIKNIGSHQEADLVKRHEAIVKEVNSQCSSWPSKRGCQRKNFKLIEKCFDGQQKFVFYILLALTDTVCQDSGIFIDFWEKGGSTCLQGHLMKLTQEISECLNETSTSPQSQDELDRNIFRITKCIGQKFSNCGQNKSTVIETLVKEIETFYKEVKYESSNLSSSAMPLNNGDGAIKSKILISLSLFTFISQLRKNALFA